MPAFQDPNKIATNRVHSIRVLSVNLSGRTVAASFMGRRIHFHQGGHFSPSDIGRDGLAVTRLPSPWIIICLDPICPTVVEDPTLGGS